MLSFSVKWFSVIDGGEVGILSGDPNLPGGAFTIRFRTSREIKVPPHWHPEDEHLTVIEGSFSLGLGDLFENRSLETLDRGQYVCIPRLATHYSVYSAGAIVQAHGIGPFKSVYVNPAEDHLGDRLPRSI